MRCSVARKQHRRENDDVADTVVVTFLCCSPMIEGSIVELALDLAVVVVVVVAVSFLAIHSHTCAPGAATAHTSCANCCTNIESYTCVHCVCKDDIPAGGEDGRPNGSSEKEADDNDSAKPACGDKGRNNGDVLVCGNDITRSSVRRYDAHVVATSERVPRNHNSNCQSWRSDASIPLWMMRPRLGKKLALLLLLLLLLLLILCARGGAATTTRASRPSRG